MIVYTPRGRPIELHHPIASGGEGTIYQTQHVDVVAKIYHHPEQASLAKIQTMVQTPPYTTHMKERDDHVAIAWPQEILLGQDGTFQGFLMPRVSGALTLNNIYNPKLRKKKAPGFHAGYLHHVAQNIAGILAALHAKRYVIGDIKTDNFLVNDKALVSLTDTDSFQVTTAREIFLCPVGSEGFTPPELIGKDFSQVVRGEDQDCFGLAVLIHLLLTGHHPYTGTWKEGTEPRTRDEAVAGGLWPYGSSSCIQLGPLAIPLEWFYSKIKDAFLKTFNEGHDAPTQRVRAKEWKNILEEASRRLQVCPEASHHLYDAHHHQCPWCQRRVRLSTDIFPQPKGQNRLHILESFHQAHRTHDARHMIALWQSHPTLKEDAKAYQDQVLENIALFQTFDTFKAMCHRGDDRATLVEFWLNHPELEGMAAFPEEQIAGKPWRAFLDTLRHQSDALARLEHAISIADEAFRERRSQLALEEAIVHHYREFHILTPAHQKGPVMSWEGRVDQATKRIVAWNKLMDPTLREAAFLHAWRSGLPFLQGFALPHEVIQKQTYAEDQEKIATQLRDFLNAHPHDEEDLLTLWNRHPTFHSSIYADDLRPSIERALRLLKDYDTLFSMQKGASLKEMADVWAHVEEKEHPRFAPFRKRVEFAHSLYQQWKKVKRAILEKEPHELLDLWDESFTPFAREFGLEDDVREAFLREMAYTAQFPALPQPYALAHRDYWEVVFPWPHLVWRHDTSTPAPYVLVAARPTYDLEDPLDAKGPVLAVAHRKEGDVRSVLLPKTMESPFFSLWPACAVCERFVPVGEKLVWRASARAAFYDISVSQKPWRKKNQLTLTLDSPVALPALTLRGSPGRMPTRYEKGSLVFNTIPPHASGGKRKIHLPLPAAFLNYEWRLDPEDPALANAVLLLRAV